MEQIEPIVIAAIQRDGLRLRSLVQDFLRSETVIADIPRPQTNDELILALSAALLELLALRTNQDPPSWTAGVGPVNEPFYLLKSAGQMKRLQMLCLQESPEPLRKRSFYAPPDYLAFA